MNDFDFLHTPDTARFQAFGNGSPFKNDPEMAQLNAKEADAAFKTCKKTVLDAYMKSQGFFKHKSAHYVRLSPIGLVEFVGIMRMPHGCRTCTLDVALIPLYIPLPVLVIGFGGRIGEMMGTGDFWWDYKDPSTASLSFQNIVEALDTFVMPWFAYYHDEAHYLQDLMQGKYYPGYDGFEYLVYAHLKNGDVKAARHFLETAHATELYERDQKYHFRLFPFEEHRANLHALLDSIDDPKAYIRSCIKESITTLKYPAAFQSYCVEL